LILPGEISYTELVSLPHILWVNTQGQRLEAKALSSGGVHASFTKPGGEQTQSNCRWASFVQHSIWQISILQNDTKKMVPSEVSAR